MPRLRRLSLCLGCAIILSPLTGCARPVPVPTRPAERAPTIVFTGDILLAGRAGRLIEEKGTGAPFAGVSEVVREADLAIGNLECAISTQGKPADKSYTFRAAPKAARALSEAGFDIMNLANNHSVDYGQEGLRDTLSALSAAGVGAVGAGGDAEGARQPALIRAGEPPITIALLAFSNMQPTIFYAGAHRPGTNPAHPDAIRQSVAAARGQADRVIVMLHWGDERSTLPSARQRELARIAVDAGADLVVGHHPHVLQGFERRGDALIAYSLGNFLFPSRGESRMTMILRYTPERNGSARLEVIPAVIEGFQPRLADAKEAADCLRRLRALSARLGAELLDSEGVITSPARAASVDKARTPP